MGGNEGNIKKKSHVRKIIADEEWTSSAVPKIYAFHSSSGSTEVCCRRVLSHFPRTGILRPVTQLQSQVMVLGESAVTTEERTGLCLERLAGLERRIGSIPVVSYWRTCPIITLVIYIHTG